jgi:DNA-binding NarL/FixJ family response regulator
MVLGFTVLEIAKEMDLREKAAPTYRARIVKKL